MEEYLNSFRMFHREQMLSMSKKKKYSHCRGCDNPKQCHIKQDGLYTVLTMSCGSSSGQCGEQFSIKVPNYIHYIDEVDNLRKQLNTGLNYKTLDNYIDVSASLTEYDQKQELIQTTLDSIEEKYNTTNDINTLSTKINQEIKQYHSLSDKASVLLFKIQQTKDNSLVKDYVTIKLRMKQSIANIYSMVHTLNPYLAITKPKVTTSTTTTISQPKKEIEFAVGDTVEWKSSGNVLRGIITKFSGKKRAVIEESITGEVYNLQRKQLTKVDVSSIENVANVQEEENVQEDDVQEEKVQEEENVQEDDIQEEEPEIDPNVKRIQLEKPQNSWDVQVRNIQREIFKNN